MIRWMIYGANGYTGRLVAQLAHARGLNPVLAGRNREEVEALAAELGFESRVFALDSVQAVSEQLRGCTVVLHCAGPFVRTSAPMADACLLSGVHYVDITGEIPAFAGLAERDERARAAGVMLLGGAGFDVVPTDCVALKLKEALPEAQTLRLAFEAISQPSGGTARSALEQLPSGGRVRENGVLVNVPLLSRSVEAVLGGRRRTVYNVPWGDVFTAYYTTGIPNIEVYKTFGSTEVLLARAAGPFLGLLSFGPVLRLAQNLAGRSGPDAGERDRGRSHVWGQVTSPSARVELQLDTIEGYEFTAESAVRIVERILMGAVRAGFQTPAAVFGADFVLEVPGTTFGPLERTSV